MLNHDILTEKTKKNGNHSIDGSRKCENAGSGQPQIQWVHKVLTLIVLNRIPMVLLDMQA